MTIDDFVDHMEFAQDNELMTAVKRLSIEENVGPILDTESELRGWTPWA